MRLTSATILASSVFLTAVSTSYAEDILVEGGYVMTMDPGVGDLEQTDVLIKGGRIVAIGRGLKAGTARRIQAKGAIVLPGFVDTHSHLYVTTMRGQFRNKEGQFFPVSSKLAGSMTPHDVETAMHLGALKLISSGITTTADFFDNVIGPAHGEVGLRALQRSGIRGTLYYGGPDKTTKHPMNLDQLRSIASRLDKSAQVGVGLAWRLPRNRTDARNWAMRQQEFDTANELGLPIQVHVSGEPGPMLDALIEREYLYPNLTVVHAPDASAEQLRVLEAAGSSLAVTPISEQRVGYGLTRFDQFALVSKQGLGIDGNSLAGSAEMFATMRLASLTWSGGARSETAPDARSLLELATIGGAEVVGMASEIGTLSVGKRADLQIIRLDSLNLAGFGGGDPSALLVHSAHPSDVDTVIIGGRVVKIDGDLVDVDRPKLLQDAEGSARALTSRVAERD